MSEYGFLGFGYGKDGYNRKGFDREGFERSGYDKFGFDRDGYNQEGFDKLGFDREGYNRQGYNRIGYDRNGFDQDGFGRNGRTKDGYDRSGFDAQGYNRAGFDLGGYNIAGYDKDGFDKDGFDVSGYDKTGYDKTGYSREGFDKRGFNHEGYNRDGFNELGYDCHGFDHEGFDFDGFNKDGYNRIGLNRDGYDRDGFDENGFNVLGFNRAGYNKEGYNQQGYDINGFNIDGFNAQGYDKDGFDIDGRDCGGYDREGYGRDGFDQSGFSRNGYDREGYDRSGFNEAGFDRQGYDREGFDINGFDHEGYNRSGFDISGRNIWGFDTNWIDRDGFNILGYDSDGYGRDGVNAEGFNREGYDYLGVHRSEYDADGYHKQTGYNRYGFNRSGQHINGIQPKAPRNVEIDKHGYDAQGILRIPCSATKYVLPTKASAKAVTKESVSELVPGDTVFHKDLGAAVIDEIDQQYYTITFNRTGTQKRFNREAFGEYLLLNPPDNILRDDEAFDTFVFEDERTHLSKAIRGISAYSEKIRESIQSKWESRSTEGAKRVIGPTGLIETMFPDFDNSAQAEYRLAIARMKDEPYFARFQYDGKDRYISRTGLRARDAIDWQSRQCQYYYQYQMYIGNDRVDLALVRDYHISNGTLYGYTDKFNATTDSEYQKYADEHLRQIVQANRGNKGIHDIISSIQQNQYKIMTSDANRDLLVLGCAGSGKTMILLHRLSYLLYNNKTITPTDSFIVSPTRYLAAECGLLSKTLAIDEVNKLLVRQIYEKIILNCCRAHAIELHISKNLMPLWALDASNAQIKELYSVTFLQNVSGQVYSILQADSTERTAFLNAYHLSFDDYSCAFHKGFDESGEIAEICETIKAFTEECREKQYSKQNLLEMEKAIRADLEKAKELYSLRQLLIFILSNGFFRGKPSEGEEENLKTWLRDVRSRKSLQPIWDRCQPLRQFAPFMDQIDLRKYSKVQDASSAIEYLLREQSKCADGVLSVASAKEVYDFLANTSENLAKSLIRAIDAKMDDSQALPVYLDILEVLKSTSWFSNKGNNFPKSYENFLKDIVKIYLRMDWDGECIGDDFRATQEIRTPFDFVRNWTQLQVNLQKIKSFEAGNTNSFFGEVVLYSLKNQFVGTDNLIINDEYTLFAYAYLCNAIWHTEDTEKKQFFFDEFQDMSVSEIELIHRAYPNSVMNYYGDINQCISPKGISTLQMAQAVFGDIEQYSINENYRNAIEITQFINLTLNMSMSPIGISGAVERLQKNQMSSFSYLSDDRVVYVVKDKDHFDYGLMHEIGAFYGWLGKQAENIPNGQPIALTVQDVKGLEFEVVIVDNRDMTDNEKYVAYTRALNKLYLYS